MKYKLYLFALLSAMVFFIPNTADAQSNDKECLATAIYHEARGEPMRGKIAVGNVIINRTKSRQYPKTICGVVYQRSRNGCQFSWVCNKNYIPKTGYSWNESLKISEQILNNEHEDYSRGALYFYSSGRPSFAKRGVLVTIGNHKFVR